MKTLTLNSRGDKKNIQSPLFCFHVAQMLHRDGVLAFADVQLRKEKSEKINEERTGSGGEEHKQAMCVWGGGGVSKLRICGNGNRWPNPREW